MSSNGDQPIEVISSYWDVFSPPVFNESTTENENVQYMEKRINVVTLNDYEIINQDLDLFILPSNSFLEVQVNVQSTANAYFNSGQIALVNNGYNLFSRAQYLMNNQLIEDVDFPGLATQILGLVEYSRDFADSGCNELWYPDYADGGVYGSYGQPITVAVAGDANPRQLRVLASKKIALNTTTANTESAITITFGSAITFSWGGSAVALRSHGAAGDNVPVDFVGIARGARLIAKNAQGKEIQFYANGVPGWLTSDGTDITFESDYNVADNAVLTAGYKMPSRTNPGFNSGFLSRRGRLFNHTNGLYDRTITLFLPIHRLFKIFESNRKVFRGVKHTVKLYKNNINGSNDLLMRDAFTNDTLSTGVGTDGKVNVKHISWWVPVLKPSPAVELELNKEINDGKSATIYWNALQCIQSDTMKAGNFYYDWRITSSSHRPVRMFVIFQYLNRYNDQTKNNMIFDHLNIDRIHCRIGSQQFPKEEYQCNFNDGTEEDISRLYNAYLHMGNNINDLDSGASLCYSDFKNLYPIFCFDLKAQDNQIWRNVTEIDIQLRVHFRDALTSDARGIALIEFERQIRIKGANQRLAVEV